MLTCSICETATVANPDEAIAKEWYPEWWIGNVQQDACCGDCGQFLHDVDGTYELIPGIDPQPTPSNDAPVMTVHEYNRERFTAEKDDWQLR